MIIREKSNPNQTERVPVVSRVNKPAEMSDVSPPDALIVKYELDECVSWINENSFSRVCLQFPDDLLQDSADVALYIDDRISTKTYILADSSFFSCCVDEVGSKHVDGDAIIHFGVSCLSQFSSLPVFYVWPKKELDLSKLSQVLSPALVGGPALILYDAGYAHLLERLGELFNSHQVAISRLICGKKSQGRCGPWCRALSGSAHSTSMSGRTFCVPSNLQSTTFIGCGKQADNFLLSLKVDDFYTYEDNKGLVKQSQFQLFKKLSFLVEKVKNSLSFGLLIGTLSVERYLDAVEHAKRLLERRKRKSYIVSVGKPTVAKLSNFPEIDVFVMVSCNQGSYIDNKDVIAPIVSLLELELAFNENRTWEHTMSSDFSHLIIGGEGYVEAPTTVAEDIANTHLTSGYRATANCSDESTDIVLRSDMTVTSLSFSSRARTWDGLALTVGDSSPAVAVPGRSGTSQGYSDEKS